MPLAANRRAHSPGKWRRGDPPWDIALLYPVQGEWTEEDYLALENNSENRLMELIDGVLEVLPMPDLYHQGIVRYLYRRLDDFVRAIKAGEVFFAPLPVRLWKNHLREPDIMFLKPQRIKGRRKPPDGADLVMEIVSPGQENRRRDLKEKRRVYAKARIPEYWIVDPENQTITIYVLRARSYKVHGKFKLGQEATSKLLSDFSVAVSEVFAAGEGR